ncbi:S24 family peptidase [Variovorax saccharolyticus]|uniref:S24 family peptidase n=1 Tax=Variovorax saccharolyticus TaxID=3053516 RepID=UPI002576E020|nr:S24 family peptidase [Variovorax sp. J31P216]MDM0028401.1 S24 family peptidase [Variovorax sp. J31P216]
MNLGARIKIAFELSGVRAPQVARATEVPVAAINALLRRNSRRSEYTEKILSALPPDKVNHEWVRSGVGSPRPAALVDGTLLDGTGVAAAARPTPPNSSNNNAPPRSWEHPAQWPKGSHVLLPKLHVGITRDGSRRKKRVTTELLKHEVLTFTTGWMRYDQLKPAGLAWAQATDTSMETVLYQGDTFVVDTEQCDVIDGKTYVIFYEGQQRVRRLFRLPGGRLRIEANNGHLFPTIELSAADAQSVTIVGRVVHRSGPGGL